MNLAEAVQTIKRDGKDISKMMENKELKEFLSLVGNCGGNVLSDVPKDSLVGAISLMTSSVMVDLLKDGEVDALIFLVENMEVFGSIMAVALRMAVGLSVVEEWR